MNRIALVVLSLFALSSVACAPARLYHWGPYEDDLYKLYKKPETAKKFHEDLKVMIDKSREKGAQIPPGIAAEYGFLEYKAGHLATAVEYLDLERRTWPESATLMTKLIERIEAEPQEDEDEPTSSPLSSHSGDAPVEAIEPPVPPPSGDGEESRPQ